MQISYIYYFSLFFYVHLQICIFAICLYSHKFLLFIIFLTTREFAPNLYLHSSIAYAVSHGFENIQLYSPGAYSI